jgi:hypothetical protein
MSADNWTVCPRCKANVTTNYIEAQEELSRAYGVVTLDKYRFIEKKVRDLFEALDEMPEALREGYEIGVDEGGIFEVSYSCSCHNCDFEFSHKESVDTLRKAVL